jgi:anaerobic C4-dicarboxylate transporter
MQGRSRFIYGLLVMAVIALGLLSRRFPQFLPAALGQSPGDALWALMVLLGFGCLFPRASTLALALASLGFSFAVEFSQLYHAPWIDAVRATRIGHLVLGNGFLWTDLVAYTVGVLVGVMLDRLMMGRRVTSS